MARLNVNFYNPVTDETMENAQEDDTSTVLSVTRALQDHGFIAPPKPGQHYILQIKGKTELTDDTSTLASGGVANGDTIQVVCAQRGGSPWSTRA